MKLEAEARAKERYKEKKERARERRIKEKAAEAARHRQEALKKIAEKQGGNQTVSIQGRYTRAVNCSVFPFPRSPKPHDDRCTR